MDINQDRLWSDIQELGRIGRSPDGGITRLAFTPQDRQAQDWLEARMRDAGLAVREDAAGNLIGELCGSRPEKPCVMCGSHYDTVPVSCRIFVPTGPAFHPEANFRRSPPGDSILPRQYRG